MDFSIIDGEKRIMGEFLGVLAGGGMLALVAVLFFAFLRECGALSPASGKRLGRAAATVLGIAAAYLLAGAVMYAVVYEPADNPAEINRIFRTPSLERMYAALRAPSFYAPLSGLFAYLGHAVGTVLFGQYLLGGEALSLLLTILGAWLLLERLGPLVGGKAAEEGLFLLFSLPGALFLMLPGWPALAFFLVSGGVYILGRRWPERIVSYSSSAYATVVSVSALLSAAVVYLAVTGRMA